ncbi:MAG TPA: PAS domain S-box protein, partial [Anaerolineaceae bacterium]|nr:PAS domain S-box protein [Anaerolineaceae bacterium]
TVLQIVNVTVPNIGEKAMLVISQPLNLGGYRVQAVGILVDIESWMDGAGIEPGLGEAAIGIRDPHGTQVFGDGRVFGNDPVIYAIDLSGSIWEIGADFEKGWAAAVEPQLVLFWVVSLAIIGLISLIIYLFLIRRIRLKNLIAQHNREMEEVIWQRRRIEQALLANEARFRLIYENLPIGYHSLNIRGELIDVNRAWLDMLGYSRVEVIGSKFTDYLTVESAEFFETFFTDYKAKGQAADVELEMVHKDGSVLMTVLDGRIGYDEEGQFRQTHCILRDVTESKRAELALRESEARYSSLFHDNNSVMLLVDPENGKIVDANPAACDFYGYPAETIKNKNIDDINMLPPVQVSRHMSHAEAGKERRFEFRHRLQNGEIRDVEVYSGPIILQGRRLLYSIVHDISQRKRAQEALKISREELQRERDLISRVMETSPVSIFMVNRSDQVTFANAHACRTFHLQKEAVDSIYQTPGFQLLDLIGQPVAQGKLPFYRLIRDGGAIYNRLYAMDWPGGERSFLSVSGAPVFKESGEIDAAIVIAEDVTEDVLSEKALRESEERFRSAFEFATVGMALTRLDGRFMMVNQALCDMLGYTEVELVGKLYTDLTYAEDLPMNKELCQQSLEGERRSFAMEKRYLHKNGNFVWVDQQHH